MNKASTIFNLLFLIPATVFQKGMLNTQFAGKGVAKKTHRGMHTRFNTKRNDAHVCYLTQFKSYFRSGIHYTITFHYTLHSICITTLFQ